MIYYSLGILASLIASIGQIFLKMSSNRKKNDLLTLLFNIHFVSGIIFFMISIFISIYVLRKIEFSSYFSLTATNFLFITLLSKVILKEPIDRQKIIGNLFIIIGVIVYNII